jgi:hypothetical protein
MGELAFTCPNCKSKIQTTERLVAPLIQAIRAQCEGRIAHKESEVAKREAAIRQQQLELAKAKAGIEQRIADAKAELTRRRCELEDAKREVNLTIETKLQESLAALRQTARQEAEDALRVEIIEKDALIASLKAQLEEKDGLIATMQRQVAEKDEQIASVQREGEKERQRIAAEEAEKARLLVATDLEGKAKELSDLQQVLKERDKKLAEAQSAQAGLIRKQRELDDAKREVELTCRALRMS